MADAKLEMEQRYISGQMTLAALSAETGTALSSLKKWSKEGGWAKKRQSFRQRAMNKAIGKAVNKRAKELAVLIEASGAAEQALLKAARQFEKAILEEARDVVDGRDAAKNLLSIAEGIERMTRARSMMGAGMTAADAEKIALLKRKQKLEEKKEQQETKAEGVQIVIGQDIEEVLDAQADHAAAD